MIVLERDRESLLTEWKCKVSESTPTLPQLVGQCDQRTKSGILWVAIASS